MRAILDILRLATGALWERKTRTLLTVLMVAVGCSLMIALKGLTAGFTSFIDLQFAKLAPNILFVSSAQDSNNDAYFAKSAPAVKAILNDVVAKRIRSSAWVADVIPVYQGLISLESHGRTVESTVFSIDPTKLAVVAPTMTLTTGSKLRANDPSAILFPRRLAEPPGQPPFVATGQTVKATYSSVSPDTGHPTVITRSFVVSGLINDTGDPNIDRGIVMNHAASNRLLQKNGRYDGLLVVAVSADYVSSVEADLREMYGRDVGISTPRAVLQTLNEFIDAFGSFTDSTAIIALLVGAVGIITTLYTSVTERTREIGTLKALGADKRFVLAMFLTEASVIGVVGATAGVGLGIVGGYALIEQFAATRPDLVPVYRVEDLAWVWALTVILALLAGLYPAWRAARVPAITALRRD
ncbi:ABC transporter permease [Stieleria varia]|uniref:Macrolide export ATP-binding/permease protein MacB n=1 Tax=Stieleria varia TaxID=2528005 RepID=A0A5C6B488_9BACT|nr:ABC transporter permease [Stieleria varia]TWU06096.1 Macrolide export ATP-binding/permease protein MacB [Stieleria varia]